MKTRHPISDPQDSFKWKKTDGRPLNKKETAEADRLWRVYMETVPEASLMEPITFRSEPLNKWLFIKFDALYDLLALSGIDVTRQSREEFIYTLTRFSRAYLQKHLDPAINAAVKMVSDNLHDQFQGVLAMMCGVPSAVVSSQFLVTRKKLKKNLNEIFRGFIEGLPQRDGRGGIEKAAIS